MFDRLLSTNHCNLILSYNDCTILLFLNSIEIRPTKSVECMNASLKLLWFNLFETCASAEVPLTWKHKQWQHEIQTNHLWADWCWRQSWSPRVLHHARVSGLSVKLVINRLYLLTSVAWGTLNLASRGSPSSIRWKTSTVKTQSSNQSEIWLSLKVFI